MITYVVLGLVLCAWFLLGLIGGFVRSVQDWKELEARKISLEDMMKRRRAQRVTRSPVKAAIFSALLGPLAFSKNI